MAGGAGGCHTRHKEEGPETHNIKAYIRCDVPEISSEMEDNTSGIFVAITVRMLVKINIKLLCHGINLTMARIVPQFVKDKKFVSVPP